MASSDRETNLELDDDKHRVITEPGALSRSIYNARSSTYDESFHPIHATNYIKWSDMQPTNNVLDLACGTGLVSLLAKRAVGHLGTVTGIDISPGMLSVAREKAAKQDLQVEWIEWNLNDLEILVKNNGLGVVTVLSFCASTLPRPNGLGRFVTDVPTELSHLPGLVFEEIAEEVGVSLAYGRRAIKSLSDLEDLLRSAGFRIEKSWRHEGYLEGYEWSDDFGDRKRVRSYSPDIGADIFDQWIGSEMYAVFRERGREGIQLAKDLFIKKFQNRAIGDGRLVVEEDAFYIVSAKTMPSP